MRYFSLRWLSFNWLVTCGLLFLLSKKPANSARRICLRQGVITIHKSPLVSCLHYLCLTLVCVTDVILPFTQRKNGVLPSPSCEAVHTFTLGQENDIVGSTDQKNYWARVKVTQTHTILMVFCCFVCQVYIICVCIYTHIHIYCVCVCLFTCVSACACTSTLHMCKKHLYLWRPEFVGWSLSTYILKQSFSLEPKPLIWLT